MESIREITQKIKTFLLFPPSDLLIVAIIILVGFSSFGLGRLSVEGTQRDRVTIKGRVGEATATQSASVMEGASVVENTATSPSGTIVASKNGSKYHFPWCSGARRIAEKNLISFNSIDAARTAGYTPAANCKGLE